MKKEAQDPSSIITGMFQQMYDPNDKAGSLSKFLGPAIVTKAMQAMGFGFYGRLVGILLSAFNVDIAGILKNVVSTLAPEIQSGKSDFTMDEIKEKVKSGFDSGFGTSKAASMSPEQIIMTKVAKSEPEPGFLSRLSDSISKFFTSDDFKRGYGNHLSGGSKTVLVRVFSTIFGILFTSMGLMAAGQGVKKLMGKPNVFDGNADKPESKDKPEVIQQKNLKYKMKDGVSTATKSMWTVPIKNDTKDISRFVINCVRNTFEVDNLSDNEISRSSVFSDIVGDINLYNSRMNTEKNILLPADYKNELTIAYPIVKDLS